MEDTNSCKFLMNNMKNSLLFGADKALMARNSIRANHLERDDGAESELCDHQRKNKAICSSMKNEEEDVFCKVLSSYPSSGGYNNEFPVLNILALLVLKIMGYQFSLFTRFLTLPIWLFLTLPLQTLLGIRGYVGHSLMRMFWGDFSYFLSKISNDSHWFKARKWVLINVGIRFGRALFWSICVWLVLLGMFVSGFVVGGLVMKCAVEEPIQTRETLNFDYTKPSPVAFVPFYNDVLTSSSAIIPRENSDINVGGRSGRSIPFYDHKLHLTVSLILPESDYNRKLGVFQVKVELVSANGKVSGSASYPCMLRYKSQPLRLVETILGSVPLIAGVQSEAQILDVKFNHFRTSGGVGGGYDVVVDPTASCFRVTLEQRAEFLQPGVSGAGIPQIYAASLAVHSELPRLKKFIWQWRMTIFVWLSILSFLTELFLFLIFLSPFGMAQIRSVAVPAKKGS